MNGAWVVRLPNWLGDVVMAIPTLIRLHESAAGRVTLWGPARYEPLLAELGVPGGYLPYRRRRGAAGWVDALDMTRTLRHSGATAALLLPNSFEPALQVALAGLPRRVGYATDGRGWLLTDSPPAPAAHPPPHEGERFSALLRVLDISPPPPPDAPLPASDALVRRSREMFDSGAQLVGLVPGAANGPAKRWSPGSFASLAESCAETWGAQPALLGSEQDKPVTEAVEASCRVPCIDLAGTDLVDLAAALLRCRVVVSNDTGAAHLAAALGRPTVTMFGPTDPQRTRPRGPHVWVTSAECFCQPCNYLVCPLDFRCMKRLEPDKVFAAVEQAWQVDA